MNEDVKLHLPIGYIDLRKFSPTNNPNAGHLYLDVRDVSGVMSTHGDDRALVMLKSGSVMEVAHTPADVLEKIQARQINAEYQMRRVRSYVRDLLKVEKELEDL